MSGETSNQYPAAVNSQFGRQLFLIKSLLSKVRTSIPVQVISCTNDGGVSPIGYVDIIPLIEQIGGDGVAIKNATIYNVPYMRLQGGSNAVIIDPQEGDIGLAAICDRDISTVKSTMESAAPASTRKHDQSDAVYTGTILSKNAPTQYIQFNDEGINITSPTAVVVNTMSAQVNAPVVEVVATTSMTITSPITTINGELAVTGIITGEAGLVIMGGAGADITGDINATGEITAGLIPLSTHTHGGVSAGMGNTGAPNP